MLPTLSMIEWVVEEKIRHEIFPQTLKRGDLVTFISPLSASQLVCKRIIGLPGDTVLADPTTLTLTHQSGGMYENTHVLVPLGHVWVQGDNAANSRDSRDYGPVPVALIRGRFVCSFGTEPSYTGIKWHRSNNFVTQFPTPREG